MLGSDKHDAIWNFWLEHTNTNLVMNLLFSVSEFEFLWSYLGYAHFTLFNETSLHYL